MHIKVLNYRGLRLADLTVEKIAMIIGANSSGKSSLIQAVGLAMARQAMPDGITKGDAAKVITEGESHAYVTVSDGEEDSVTIGWPDAEVRTEGKSPAASAYAMGLRSLCTDAPAVRAEALIETLRAKPTRDDLAAAFKEAGLREGAVQPIWDLVTSQGWDGAVDQIETTRASYKGQWGAITGETWGSKKSADWHPAGWTDDLEGASLDDLERDAKVAQGHHEDTLRRVGAGDGERARLKAIVDTLPALKVEVAAQQTAAISSKKALDDAVAARSKLPPVPDATKAKIHTVPCPHCGALSEVKVVPGDRGIGIASIELMQSSAEELGTKDAALSADVRKRIAEADGAVARATSEYEAAERKLTEMLLSKATAEKAEKDLAAMKTGGADQQEVGTAKASWEAAVRRHTIASENKKARALHDAIEGQNKITALLKPTGLRQKKLAEKLVDFNARLAELADTAVWGHVTCEVQEKTVEFAYGGRAYALLAENEQFRTRAVLACAQAALDGSNMLAIDAADVLDMNPDSRVGLIKMALAVGKPALIGMTVTLPINKVPDLRKAGVGETFVVQAGVLRVYDPEKDAA
jgi:hypothetical protein